MQSFINLYGCICMSEQYKYFELKGTIEGDRVVIYGSYSRKQCSYELSVERASLKAEGYTDLKIEGRLVQDAPDMSIYDEDVIK